MLTNKEFEKYAMNLYDFCTYPAAKYCILFTLLDYNYDDKRLIDLRKDFLHSDIVEELYKEQSPYGD